MIEVVKILDLIELAVRLFGNIAQMKVNLKRRYVQI